MYIRTVLVHNLIEAALDQRNPSQKLKGTLNQLLRETDHRDKVVTPITNPMTGRYLRAALARSMR